MRLEVPSGPEHSEAELRAALYSALEAERLAFRCFIDARSLVTLKSWRTANALTDSVSRKLWSIRGLDLRRSTDSFVRGCKLKEEWPGIVALLEANGISGAQFRYQVLSWTDDGGARLVRIMRVDPRHAVLANRVYITGDDRRWIERFRHELAAGLFDAPSDTVR